MIRAAASVIRMAPEMLRPPDACTAIPPAETVRVVEKVLAPLMVCAPSTSTAVRTAAAEDAHHCHVLALTWTCPAEAGALVVCTRRTPRFLPLEWSCRSKFSATPMTCVSRSKRSDPAVAHLIVLGLVLLTPVTMATATSYRLSSCTYS